MGESAQASDTPCSDPDYSSRQLQPPPSQATANLPTSRPLSSTPPPRSLGTLIMYVLHSTFSSCVWSVKEGTGEDEPSSREREPLTLTLQAPKLPPPLPLHPLTFTLALPLTNVHLPPFLSPGRYRPLDPDRNAESQGVPLQRISQPPPRFCAAELY